MAAAAMAAGRAAIVAGKTQEEIDRMTPVEIILVASRLAAKQGNWSLAASIADKAAPYIHPKAQPKLTDDEGYTIKIVGGLPEDIGDDEEADVTGPITNPPETVEPESDNG